MTNQEFASLVEKRIQKLLDDPFFGPPDERLAYRTGVNDARKALRIQLLLVSRQK